MKKAKNSSKKDIQDPTTQKGIPAHDPHADFAKKDANFKKSRGSQS